MNPLRKWNRAIFAILQNFSIWNWFLSTSNSQEEIGKNIPNMTSRIFMTFSRLLCFYVFVHNISCKLWYLCVIVASLLYAPGCVEAKICDVFIKAFYAKSIFPRHFQERNTFLATDGEQESRKHLAKATDDYCIFSVFCLAPKLDHYLKFAVSLSIGFV